MLGDTASDKRSHIPPGRLGRGTLAAIIGSLVLTGAGTAVALGPANGTRSSHRQLSAARTHRSKDRKGRTRGRVIHASEAFAVLSHPQAQAAAAHSQAIPAGAVLAAQAGERSLYLWERHTGESLGFPGEHLAREAVLCIGEVGPGGASASCGSLAKMAEEGSVAFGEEVDPRNGKVLKTLRAVVPNGIDSISVTDAGGTSYDVAIRDNVAIVEDSQLATPPASAVSYRLPDGRMRRVMAVATEPSPQSG